MKTRFAAASLLGLGALLASSAAWAQTTAPDFPTSPSPGRPAPARSVAPAPDAARARRQQQMTPEEAARDQQMQIMEARTGNTSFGVERGGPYRQQDKGNGAFTVRKFKELPGQEQKRGETRRVLMGAQTTGKPLVHKHKKKHKFLFF